MVVPHIVKIVDGKPDFAKLDLRLIYDCLEHGLCIVCGLALSAKKAYWIGSRYRDPDDWFGDAPMHLNCAKTALNLCPFLKNQGESLAIFVGSGIIRSPDNPFLTKPEKLRRYIIAQSN